MLFESGDRLRLIAHRLHWASIEDGALYSAIPPHVLHTLDEEIGQTGSVYEAHRTSSRKA